MYPCAHQQHPQPLPPAARLPPRLLLLLLLLLLWILETLVRFCLDVLTCF
jgi:hypothetical protein